MIVTDIKNNSQAVRRLAVAAAAAVLLCGLTLFGSASAHAFSRPGLPVEYIMVPSPS
ncbi:MAG TPA: diacylglycerol acyltransferase/mycolyltransferase Ag85A, partial [Mycobacterium sp.]|nr:diacylglycerol acyltransferase/mycolyltransferase Ag85A [Mycobacterium sp.]